MLNHDQNPVDPEIKIEGEDTASKSTEVETELENKEEPKIEETTPETEIDEPEEPVAEMIQEEASQSEEVLEEASQSEVVPEEETIEEPKEELSPEELEHENMLSMYEESFSNFKVGEIIEGTIVDISDKEVRVDIGFKSEGVIPITEFAYSGPPEKYSTIRVFINKIESGDGRLQLS
ncbi:MAG: S1 RNA-binding domain-containing protein, partial [Candidatus Cloacimonetes bacterium]|nr:S1 RNA-binding domain-containing protein [Candidatus Cloacimonadota bacterium]